MTSQLAAKIAKHRPVTKALLAYLADHKWHSTQDVTRYTGIAKPIHHIRMLRSDGLVIDMRIVSIPEAPRQFLYRLVTPLGPDVIDAMCVDGKPMPSKQAPIDIPPVAKKKLPGLSKEYLAAAIADWEHQSRGLVKDGAVYHFDPAVTDEDMAFAASQARECKRELERMGAT